MSRKKLESKLKWVRENYDFPFGDWQSDENIAEAVPGAIGLCMNSYGSETLGTGNNLIVEAVKNGNQVKFLGKGQWYDVTRFYFRPNRYRQYEFEIGDIVMSPMGTVYVITTRGSFSRIMGPVDHQAANIGDRRGGDNQTFARTTGCFTFLCKPLDPNKRYRERPEKDLIELGFHLEEVNGVRVYTHILNDHNNSAIVIPKRGEFLRRTVSYFRYEAFGTRYCNYLSFAYDAVENILEFRKKGNAKCLKVDRHSCGQFEVGKSYQIVDILICVEKQLLVLRDELGNNSTVNGKHFKPVLDDKAKKKASTKA